MSNVCSAVLETGRLKKMASIFGGENNVDQEKGRATELLGYYMVGLCYIFVGYSTPWGRVALSWGFPGGCNPDENPGLNPAVPTGQKSIHSRA
jgi:hypothetical protein